MHLFVAIFFVVFSSCAAATAHAPTYYIQVQQQMHYFNVHCTTALYITTIVISSAMDNFLNFECSYKQVVGFGPWQHIHSVY